MNPKVTLHLGVLDQNYRNVDYINYQGKRIKKSAAHYANTRNSPMTTGDVASILEAKYGLFSAFYKAKEQSIADGIALSMKGAIEALVAGRAIDPWGHATQNIQKEFRDFISTREAERVGMVGVPTQAALRGVNHRLKHPYRKSNQPRPSFQDTGLLRTSFRAWIDSK